MSNGTKDRILEAALEIFSRKGYAGTNLKDIADEVGVVKSAFYRHYESKEEVWNAVLDRLESYYEERFGSPGNPPAVPESTQELKTMAMRMLDFTVHDEKIIIARKFLLSEQFRDERAKKLAAAHFMDGTKDIFRSIFEKMTEKGLLVNEDPDMLAFVFTSPITTLVHCCDREPEKEPGFMHRAEEYIGHFIRIYGKDGT